VPGHDTPSGLIRLPKVEVRVWLAFPLVNRSQANEPVSDHQEAQHLDELGREERHMNLPRADNAPAREHQGEVPFVGVGHPQRDIPHGT
jgi:hypothetical protein